MLSTTGKALRVISIVLCLTVVTSFAVFAIDQTSSASDRQQQALTRETPGGTTVGASAPPAASAASHEGGLHQALDDVAGEITSPFSPITSGSSSEWAVRGVNLLLAMIVYGFGIGFLARWMRVRV